MIGTQWESPRGLRKVESECEHSGATMFLVRTGNNPFCDILTASDIAETQERDAANLASRAKANAAAQERERAENEQKANSPLERFLSTLPPMKAGRARKSLTMLQRINGGAAQSRAQNIRDLLAAGYRPRGDRLECEGAPGYFSGRDFTSFGMEFARFIEREEVQA